MRPTSTRSLAPVRLEQVMPKRSNHFDESIWNTSSMLKGNGYLFIDYTKLHSIYAWLFQREGAFRRCSGQVGKSFFDTHNEEFNSS